MRDINDKNGKRKISPHLVVGVSTRYSVGSVLRIEETEAGGGNHEE